MRGGVMTRRQMVRIHPPAPIGRLIAAPTGCGTVGGSACDRDGWSGRIYNPPLRDGNTRIWCNGSTAASQAVCAGSSPVIRSTAGWAWPAALSKRPSRAGVTGCAPQGVDRCGQPLSQPAADSSPYTGEPLGSALLRVPYTGEPRCACGVAGNMAAFQAAVAGSRPVTRSTAGGFQPAGSSFFPNVPGNEATGCAPGDRRGSFPPRPLQGPGD